MFDTCSLMQSPSMGRRVSPTESGAVPVAPKVGDGDTEPKEDEATIPPAESPVATQTAAQKLAAANVAAANAEVPPDPYAREAKHFTEVRVLNRDVSKLDDTCKSCGSWILHLHNFVARSLKPIWVGSNCGF